MLITFNVSGEKVSHDLGKRTLVAGSSGIVQAAFVFDQTWDEFQTVAVFSNTDQCHRSVKPVKIDGDTMDIPSEVLKSGLLYVSVIGFGDGGKRRTTLKWKMSQAIAIQECGALGGFDLLRNMTKDGVEESDVATDAEVDAMLEAVFGYISGDGTDEDDQPEGSVDEADVATDQEIQDMLDDVFGDV